MANNDLSVLVLLSLIMIFSGCTHVISRDLRRNIREKTTIHEVMKDPDIYEGKMVLWGGKILMSINRKEGTLIEVLQLPLDSSDRPKDVDTSGGRFLVLYPGYLDVVIYRQGREITVAGKIKGIRKLPLGEIKYVYPLLKAEEIHLWKIKPEKIRVYHEYPPYPYWYPYWWEYLYCW